MRNCVLYRRGRDPLRLLRVRSRSWLRHLAPAPMIVAEAVLPKGLVYEF